MDGNELARHAIKIKEKRLCNDAVASVAPIRMRMQRRERSRSISTYTHCNIAGHPFEYKLWQDTRVVSSNVKQNTARDSRVFFSKAVLITLLQEARHQPLRRLADDSKLQPIRTGHTRVGMGEITGGNIDIGVMCTNTHRVTDTIRHDAQTSRHDGAMSGHSWLAHDGGRHTRKAQLKYRHARG